MKVTLPRAILLSTVAHLALLATLGPRLLPEVGLPGEALPEPGVEVLLLENEPEAQCADPSSPAAMASTAEAGPLRVRRPTGRQLAARGTGRPQAQARSSMVPPVRRGQAGGGLQVLSCLHCVRPRYPLRARRHGWAGKVEVAVEVDPRGVPRKARILASSGYRDLDRAATHAALRSRFRPQRSGGGAVAARGRIVYQFELRR